MESTPLRLQALVDLEARHDELIRQLDALDRRVERVLKECLATNARPPAQGEKGPPLNEG
jgi:hypothetical protein